MEIMYGFCVTKRSYLGQDGLIMMERIVECNISESGRLILFGFGAFD